MTFEDILEYDDFSRVDSLLKKYNLGLLNLVTYFDFFKHAYKQLTRFYQCEYVYKNEIVNSILPELIKQSGSGKTLVFNEFRVGRSIADIAFFNGQSKAFEIKTELDTPKRLRGQIDDYSIDSKHPVNCVLRFFEI